MNDPLGSFYGLLARTLYSELLPEWRSGPVFLILATFSQTPNQNVLICLPHSFPSFSDWNSLLVESPLSAVVQERLWVGDDLHEFFSRSLLLFLTLLTYTNPWNSSFPPFPPSNPESLRAQRALNPESCMPSSHTPCPRAWS